MFDRLRAGLRRKGGWRALLWGRPPGHYDHIHVALKGGWMSDYQAGGSPTPYRMDRNDTET